MGTCNKGGSLYYRSIGQNAMIAGKKYGLHEGYFGVSSPSVGNRTRNISSEDPLVTAKDFYDKIAFGGKEKTYKNGAMKITHMADGTIVTWREVSTSDGTPVVEINIKDSTHSGGIKNQKIHFIKGKKK